MALVLVLVLSETVLLGILLAWVSLKVLLLRKISLLRIGVLNIRLVNLLPRILMGIEEFVLHF